MLDRRFDGGVRAMLTVGREPLPGRRAEGGDLTWSTVGEMRPCRVERWSGEALPGQRLECGSLAVSTAPISNLALVSVVFTDPINFIFALKISHKVKF